MLSRSPGFSLDFMISGRDINYSPDVSSFFLAPVSLLVVVDIGPFVVVFVVGVFKSRFVRCRFLIVPLRCVWHADKLIIGREKIFEIGVKYCFVIETVASG